MTGVQTCALPISMTTQTIDGSYFDVLISHIPLDEARFSCRGRDAALRFGVCHYLSHVKDHTDDLMLVLLPGPRSQFIPSRSEHFASRHQAHTNTSQVDLHQILPRSGDLSGSSYSTCPCTSGCYRTFEHTATEWNRMCGTKRSW